MTDEVTVSTQHPHHCGCCPNSSVHLVFHFWTRPRNTPPLGTVNCPLDGVGTPPFPAEIHDPRLDGANSLPLHTRQQTIAVQTRGHHLMTPTEPHHPEKAPQKTKSWGHQSGDHPRYSAETWQPRQSYNIQSLQELKMNLNQGPCQCADVYNVSW